MDLEHFKALRHVTLEINGRAQFESGFLAEYGTLPRAEVVAHSFGWLPQRMLGNARALRPWRDGDQDDWLDPANNRPGA